MSNNNNREIRVHFRVDAGETIGLGHLSRCRSLIVAFQQNAACRFTVTSKKNDIAQTFLKNFPVDFIDGHTKSNEQIADIGIVDVIELDVAERKKLRESSKILVCIDDFGVGIPGQDILIQPNLSLPIESSTMSDVQYWFGRHYIILHPDFTKATRIWTSENRNVRNLLVCFGGSDPNNLTLRVLPLLKKIGLGLEVHFIVGAGYKHLNKLMAEIEDEPKFHLSINIENLAEAIWSSDIVLVSGGTLLYETCVLGKPALVISQNELQDIESQLFEKAGCIVNLGIHNNISDTEIIEQLQLVTEDKNKRKTLCIAAKRFIYPDGARRIVSNLLKHRVHP